MAAKYDQRWTARYPDEATLEIAQGEWARELAAFSNAQIRAGLDRVTQEYPKWPPVLGEFKELCRFDPGQFGLPNASEAWDEICREVGQYSHGVILAALRDPACQIFEWRQTLGGYQAWEKHYQKYVDAAIQGEGFELPVMVEDQRDPNQTRAQAQAYADIHLIAVKRALRGEPTTEETNDD